MVIRGVLGSLIGGAIGALVWAGVAYFIGIELGWLAVGVGFLCGVGMSVGAKDDTDTVTGVIAAIIALVAIAGGKYIVVEATASKFTSQMNQQLQLTDADLRLYLASQIVQEYESQGKALVWPEGITSNDDTEKIEDYPADVIKDLDARWSAMTLAQVEEYRRQTTEYLKGQTSEIVSQAKSGAFTASFGWLDIVFGIIAIAAAFQVGSGKGD